MRLSRIIPITGVCPQTAGHMVIYIDRPESWCTTSLPSEKWSKYLPKERSSRILSIMPVWGSASHWWRGQRWTMSGSRRMSHRSAIVVPAGSPYIKRASFLNRQLTENNLQQRKGEMPMGEANGAVLFKMQVCPFCFWRWALQLATQVIDVLAFPIEWKIILLFLENSARKLI